MAADFTFAGPTPKRETVRLLRWSAAVAGWVCMPLVRAGVLVVAAAGAAAAQTPRTPAESAVVLLDSSRAMMSSGVPGSIQRALGLARASEALAGRAGSPRLQAAAALLLSALYDQLRAPDSSLASGRRGLLAARTARAADVELEALYRVSQACYRLGAVESLLAYSSTGLLVAQRAADVRAATLFLQGVALAHWSLGRADSAAGAVTRALGVAAQGGDTLALRRARENAYALAQTMGEAAIDSLGGQEVLFGSEPPLARSLARARDLWALAATLYGMAGDHAGALSLGAMNADMYLRQGRPDSALSVARAVEEAATTAGLEQLRDVAVRIEARALQAMGSGDSAIVALRRAAPSGDSIASQQYQAATAITQASVSQARRGQVDSALAALRERIEEARRRDDRRSEMIALVGTGEVYAAVRRPEPALRALQQAARLAAEQADTSVLVLALSALSASWLDLGQADSAAAANRRAWRLAAGGDPRQRGSVALGLGVDYQRLGEYDSADTYLSEALRAPGFDRHPPVRLALAEVASRRGQPRAALEHVRVVLELAPDTSDFSVRALRLAGRAYLSVWAKDSAAAVLSASLARARALGRPNLEMSALQHLALLFIARGSVDSLRRSVAYADSAAAVAALLRRWAGTEENALEIEETTNDLFETWVWGWVLLGAAGAPGDPTLAALGALERGRAQSLLDLMRRTRHDIRPGADLAAEAAAVVRRATQHRSAALVYLSTPHFLFLFVVSPGGEVELVPRPVGEDSVAVLVAAWRASLGVDGADALPLVDRGGRPLEPGRGLGVGGPAAGSGPGAGAVLAALLLPERSQMAHWGDSTDIIIVPHGALALVPFAALPFEGGQPLGVRFALRYAPSLAALAEAEERPRVGFVAAQRGRSLVVGDPAMPSALATSGERAALSPLPGAAREARLVASRLGAPALIGAAAGEEVVRRAMAGAPLIHLATHGYAYASPELARESFVALAPSGAFDGLLTVGELLDDERLRLGAELVVLSACQTGLGDLKEMEGIVGLQRAFLAKGARSVLVSQWSVSDEATALLMDRFYAHWLADADRPSKADALRQAQGDVREQRDATGGQPWLEPRYWAAFQLVGAR